MISYPAIALEFQAILERSRTGNGLQAFRGPRTIEDHKMVSARKNASLPRTIPLGGSTGCWGLQGYSPLCREQGCRLAINKAIGPPITKQDIVYGRVGCGGRNWRAVL